MHSYDMLITVKFNKLVNKEAIKTLKYKYAHVIEDTPIIVLMT